MASTHTQTDNGQLFAGNHREATKINQLKRSLLGGSPGIFDLIGKAAVVPEIAEETVRDLGAKIGELAVAIDFLSRRLKSWIGK